MWPSSQTWDRLKTPGEGSSSHLFRPCVQPEYLLKRLSWQIAWRWTSWPPAWGETVARGVAAFFFVELEEVFRLLAALGNLRPGGLEKKFPSVPFCAICESVIWRTGTCPWGQA